MVPGSSPGGPTKSTKGVKMIVERLKQILDTLAAAEADAEKTEAGNASAGRRVRKVCMEITKELKDLRALILEQSKK